MALACQNPSFAAGWARCRAESAFPDLWKGLVAAYLPTLGICGARLDDVSGRGEHGLFVNGPTWGTSPYGPVIEFDSASSQYVDCGPLTSLDGATEVTMMALLRYDATWVQAVGPIDQRVNRISLGGVRSGGVKASGYINGTGLPFNLPPPPMDGTWVQIAWTYHQPSNIVTYYNESLESEQVSGPGTVIVANPLPGTYLLRLGSGGAGAQFLDGAIAFAAVWRRALPLVQIHRLYAMFSAPWVSRQILPVAASEITYPGACLETVGAQFWQSGRLIGVR